MEIVVPLASMEGIGVKVAQIAMNTVANVRQAVGKLADTLLAQRDQRGVWVGHLSSSALATATAVSALSLTGRGRGNEQDVQRAQAGVDWLLTHQNGDGGWGDTTDSPSNLSTTLLAIAALKLSGRSDEATLTPAMAYIREKAGDTPAQWQAALEKLYGADRTFAVPILTNLALAGLVPWAAIPPLPWELAGFPQGAFRLLRLHVVSYALPALIAIGLRLAYQNGQGGLVRRLLARLMRDRAIARLPLIQPEHGGFLDAIPLTSFVAMSLAGLPGVPESVGALCADFLRSRQRDDGSWPIDTNLSVWLTTASVEALNGAAMLHRLADGSVQRFLTESQYCTVHPYTDARPGGWAWTDLPGGVPDADDTSGAILSLVALRQPEPIEPAVRWLLSIQNADGGFPTFCRGWGKLPFDRSAADVTAHAMRAMHASLRAGVTAPVGRATERAVRFLAATQADDGSWKALWFGNQYAADHANRVIGTAKVLRALAVVRHRFDGKQKAMAYLIAQQNEDGGWGGERGIASTMEETAQAVGALASWRNDPEVAQSVGNGIEFLLRGIDEGRLARPAPIGLYFASLWYSERLYPVIWTLEALARTIKPLQRD